MNKEELVKNVSDEIGVLQTETAIIVDVVLQEIYKGIIKNDKVTFKDFGAFHKTIRKPRLATNPRTGEEVKVAGKMSILKGLYWYFLGIRNHLACRRKQVHTQDYAILNDVAFNYRLLTYYVSKRAQVKTLQSIGFSQVELINEAGSDTHPEAIDRDSPWIYYVARK